MRTLNELPARSAEHCSAGSCSSPDSTERCSAFRFPDAITWLAFGLFGLAMSLASPASAQSENAETLPPLTTFAGIEKVVVVKDGKALEKTVSTGQRRAGWVEIVSGLAPGETVVLDPGGLRTGQPVTLDRAPDAAAPQDGSLDSRS